MDASARRRQATAGVPAPTSRGVLPGAWTPRYKWYGASALVVHEQGKNSEAQTAAKQALEAAQMTHRAYRHHPSVGLVGDTSDASAGA